MQCHAREFRAAQRGVQTPKLRLREAHIGQQRAYTRALLLIVGCGQSRGRAAVLASWCGPTDSSKPPVSSAPHSRSEQLPHP